MPKDLDQLRRSKEFISHAEKKGAKIRQGKGSHTVVEYNNESFVIPVHNEDLGKGLRHKIVKWFIAVGLGILALIFIIPGLFLH